MVGAALAPALIDILTASQPIIAGIIKWIDENRQLVVTIAAVAAATVGIGTALVVVGTTITLIGSSLGALAGLATFLAPIALPIAAIAAAVVGLGLAFPQWQDAASGVFGWMLEQWQSLSDFVGPIIGGVTAVAVAIATSPRLAVTVGIYFFILHQLESNILVPKIMERRVGVSPVAVLIALLIGGALLGLIGAILAIPTAAILAVFIEEFASRGQLRESD
jgi:hypothetical protein